MDKDGKPNPLLLHHWSGFSWVDAWLTRISCHFCTCLLEVCNCQLAVQVVCALLCVNLLWEVVLLVLPDYSPQWILIQQLPPPQLLL